jgi:hypothetical protein
MKLCLGGQHSFDCPSQSPAILKIDYFYEMLFKSARLFE